MTDSTVRFEHPVTMRVDSEVMQSLNRLASAERSKVSEVLRRMTVKSLEAKGMLKRPCEQNGNLGSADRDAVSAEPA